MLATGGEGTVGRRRFQALATLPLSFSDHRELAVAVLLLHDDLDALAK